jgi:hypothetical protein
VYFLGKILRPKTLVCFFVHAHTGELVRLTSLVTYEMQPFVHSIYEILKRINSSPR